jgi:hypothetical protein
MFAEFRVYRHGVVEPPAHVPSDRNCIATLSGNNAVVSCITSPKKAIVFLQPFSIRRQSWVIHFFIVK